MCPSPAIPMGALFGCPGTSQAAKTSPPGWKVSSATTLIVGKRFGLSLLLNWIPGVLPANRTELENGGVPSG